MQAESETSIPVLPEGCITDILSFTSPLDACSSALVSTMFKSAADSDVVWGKFLPSDYEDLLSKSALNLTQFSSKKELYQRLCGAPVLLEGGNKSLHLEKKSGKKCITLGARELTIVWGDSPQYWTWRPHFDSRFAEIAKLLMVCWFEIHGKIDTRMLSPHTTYGAYLVVKKARGDRMLDYPPADATVEFVEGVGRTSAPRSVYLVRPRPDGYGPRPRPAIDEDQLPRVRRDGWMEIEIGVFYNDNGQDGEVQMRVKEAKGGQWKSGLIVEGMELRPIAE